MTYIVVNRLQARSKGLLRQNKDKKQRKKPYRANIGSLNLHCEHCGWELVLKDSKQTCQNESCSGKTVLKKWRDGITREFTIQFDIECPFCKARNKEIFSKPFEYKNRFSDVNSKICCVGCGIIFNLKIESWEPGYI